MKEIVTFDLDSTLADTQHRQHMINRDGGATDWAAYAQECYKDKPVVSVVLMLHALSERYDIWIVSARDGSARERTQHWLASYGIHPKGMILDDGTIEHTPSHGHYKLAAVELIEEMTGQKVAMHVDDWAQVAWTFQQAGRYCLCLTPPQTVAAFATADRNALG